MTDLLILDFNNILFRSCAVHGNLWSKAGEYTGGLFGFIDSMCSYINIFSPRKIVVCDDSPPYLRSKIYPEYKQSRKKIKEEKDYEELKFKRKESRKFCEEFLKILGILRWAISGLECDDLIAHLCKKLDRYKIMICSNDDDLYQLLNEKVSIYKGKKGVYTRESFRIDHPGLEPPDWIYIKSMAGNHNGVSGIKGIGDITAKKIYSDPEKFEKFWNENEKELFLFKKLVKLPYPIAEDGLDHVVVPYVPLADFSRKEILRFFKRFDIQFGFRFRNAIERIGGII